MHFIRLIADNRAGVYRFLGLRDAFEHFPHEPTFDEVDESSERELLSSRRMFLQVY